MDRDAEIFFPGTGSGTVSLKRNHSSFIIKNHNHNILVEAGEGITRALISSGWQINNIDSILISHFHSDHLNGIPTLFNQMKMTGRNKILQVFVHENLLEDFIRFIHTSYIYLERLKFEINLIGFKSGVTQLISDDLIITAKENKHLNKLIGLVPAEKIVSCSFLFTFNNLKLFYTGDVSSLNDLYLFIEDKPDYIISESTHISFEDLVKLFDLLKPRRLFITHIADDLEEELKIKHQKLPPEIKPKIIMTKDKDIYLIP